MMGKKVKYGEFDPANSDGCTLISWFFRYLTSETDLPFKDCCVEHDRVYYYGGDVKLRKEADKNMRECVKAHGYPVLAWIMWAFVRLLSGPQMPFPWTWEVEVTILPKEDEPK